MRNALEIHLFTKYFIKACDGFIAMSKQVFSDLKKFTNKPAELFPIHCMTILVK